MAAKKANPQTPGTKYRDVDGVIRTYGPAKTAAPKVSVPAQPAPTQQKPSAPAASAAPRYGDDSFNTGQKDSRGRPIFKDRPTNTYFTIDPNTGNKIKGGTAPPSADSPGSSNLPTTGNKQLDGLQDELSDYAQKQKDSGNNINANIEITPQQVQQFVDQASREIDPYYTSIYQQNRQSLQSATAELLQSYQLREQETQVGFEEALQAKRQSLAERGLLQSTIRVDEEKALADSFQRQLTSLRNTTLGTGRANIESVQSNIGSRNLTGVAAPSLNTITARGFVPGQSALKSPYQKESSALFSLSPDITGRLEEEQTRSRRLREEELKRAFREQEARRVYAGA